ncbi:hypothetical protein DFA_02984 [Cavenderia fasciculata]|uniref:Uncharacterized protein n=1 Tax=Cavenderia fasciculata TaxID=261658 RepID=F4PGA6_CACFS|nr:uncharacterized protein DFA_02984 [Cavenderia fasciculata]EGG24740.1 hypothetical protein DFA_02984 [Cavenderia fasciculata]|eukprot:XP_004362591.1 hypothetical protein DFA_02984 [Cavenderia fasciculata]
MAIEGRQLETGILVFAGVTSIICLIKTIHLFKTKRNRSFNRLKEAIHVITTIHSFFLAITQVPTVYANEAWKGQYFPLSLPKWYIAKGCFTSISYTLFSFVFMLLLTYWIGMYQDIFTISKGNLLTRRTKILYFSLLVPILVLSVIHFIGSLTFQVTLKFNTYVNNLSIILLCVIFIGYSLYVLFFEKRVHSPSKKMVLMIARGILVSTTYIILCIFQLPHVEFYIDSTKFGISFLQCVVILEVQLIVYFDWWDLIRGTKPVILARRLKSKICSKLGVGQSNDSTRSSEKTTNRSTSEFETDFTVYQIEHPDENSSARAVPVVEMSVISGMREQEKIGEKTPRHVHHPQILLTESTITDTNSVQSSSEPTTNVETPDLLHQTVSNDSLTNGEKYASFSISNHHNNSTSTTSTSSLTSRRHTSFSPDSSKCNNNNNTVEDENNNNNNNSTTNNVLNTSSSLPPTSSPCCKSLFPSFCFLFNRTNEVGAVQLYRWDQDLERLEGFGLSFYRRLGDELHRSSSSPRDSPNLLIARLSRSPSNYKFK